MKTVASETVKINNNEVNVYIEKSALLIETKAGAMTVTSVSVSKSNISFRAGEKEITAPFVGNSEIVRAMFNVCNSEKAKELVVFDSYEEYLENQNCFGVSFDANGIVAAYKY